MVIVNKTEVLGQLISNLGGNIISTETAAEGALAGTPNLVNSFSGIMDKERKISICQKDAALFPKR